MKTSTKSCSPSRIARWIQTWFNDGSARGELRAIELVHVEGMKEPVTVWRVGQDVVALQLAHDIATRAEEDAQGLGDKCVRYVLLPYFGDSTQPGGRATFHVEVSDLPYESYVATAKEGSLAHFAIKWAEKLGGNFESARASSDSLRKRLRAPTSMEQLCEEVFALRRELRDVSESLRRRHDEG